MKYRNNKLYRNASTYRGLNVLWIEQNPSSATFTKQNPQVPTWTKQVPVSQS